MGKYNIGEVWWTQFPFKEIDESKRRPAIVIDEKTIAVLAMMVTSQAKTDPYSIKIDDWQEAGLTKESWARIDRVVDLDEWRMEKVIGDLSEHDFLKITQLFAEVTSGTSHEFLLLAVKNPEGKYLQVFDERWNNWLFPYYRGCDNNKELVDEAVKELLQKELSADYVGKAIHCKYSVSDKVYKHYNHKLYKVVLENIPENMSAESFELDGKKYSWKSMEELEKNESIMEINDDVIAFVKSKCE